jgi:hypothetical protein
MAKNQKHFKKMVSTLEPIRRDVSAMSNIERNETPVALSSSTFKKHETPKVNMNVVFRDGSAMPNTRSGSPSVADANLVD